LGTGTTRCAGTKAFVTTKFISYFNLLKVINKKAEPPFILKAARPSKFRPVAFRLPITRNLALSYGCND